MGWTERATVTRRGPERSGLAASRSDEVLELPRTTRKQREALPVSLPAVSRTAQLSTPIRPFLGATARRLLDGERELLAPVELVEPGTESEVARQASSSCVSRPAAPRTELAEALGHANQSWGHPRARVLAEALADPSTPVVVTGQQPGFLGGPIYTLCKIVAAVKWAELITSVGDEIEGSMPAVAVFWMAGEDHDFDEMSQWCLSLPGELRSGGLGEDPQPLVPMGSRAIPDHVPALLEELGAAASPWLSSCLREAAAVYANSTSWTEGFARLLVSLLGDRCPLLLDAEDPAIKRTQQAALSKLVSERAAVAEALDDRAVALEANGFEHQVRHAPEWSPLFEVGDDGCRRRIGWVGDDAYQLRGSDDPLPVTRLEELIESTPERVSPGVLARPAVQDAMLSTSVFVVGPGELSYLPQVAPVYELIGARPARLALRPQCLLLDERRSGQLSHLIDDGLPLGLILGPMEDLEQVLAAEADDGSMDRLEGRFDELLDELATLGRKTDPGLVKPASKTADQIRRGLGMFRDKHKAALARRNETRRGRIDTLRSLCLPGGKLQERVLSSVCVPGVFGEAAITALFEQLEIDPRELRIITPRAPGDSPR